ncbi:MAG TPA: tetratricopeptide repeat protein [Bacteroidia bacterium]|nr:tetratricopeptide repeat protein [Bacteroidia bacterium]
MQNNTIKLLSVVAGSAILLSACDGLGKMVKKQDLITHDVTPKPLEEKADSVAFTISGKYPAKVFAKKATVTVTPVIKFNGGGEKALEPIVLLGEKAVGNGQKIPFDKGGTYSKSFSTSYEPGMKNAILEIRAKGAVKKKEKEFKGVKIADGTIITPLLVRNDEKGIFAKDAFVKTAPANQVTHIYYTINQSNVRAEEMKSEEMKTVSKFIMENLHNTWYDFKGVDVSAYASPDGETDKNEHLAQDRAKTATDAMVGTFKKHENKKITFGKTKEQYKTITTREDWEGFKAAMQASNMKDKDLVLRVLTMYADPEQRRKEIKNLAATYKELAEQILPKLRRAEITIMVDKKSRTDEMISRLATTHPDSLSIEELLYGATLTNDLNTKLSIYQAAEKQYGTDWRSSNNLGVAYLMNNKVDDAKAAFDRAAKNASSNAIVMNNTGIIYSKQGDRKTAMDYYNKAAGAGAEVNYNKGILNIRDGKYTDAVTNFGDYKGFNLALAQLLNGNPESVATTIDASNEKDMAMSFYLKAVASSRKGDATGGLAFLKTAIEKDASLKAAAKDDCEFLKWRDNADFKSLTN